VNYTAFFHSDAESEMNEAAEFLNRRSLGLGVAFLTAVEEAVRRIRTCPESAPIIRGNVRRWVMENFPYSIVYSVRSTQIRILAVCHHKRRPYYWISRQ
jgi:plasmid stabilization system protein ParE